MPAISRVLPLPVVAASVIGCAGRGPVVLAPAMDPRQTALAVEDHTGLDEPVRIVFRWHLNEAGVRVEGRGVARIEPPYKARLDLFLGNGETVVRAALVNEDLRLPPGAPENILPPPDLMWGVLGVFRPSRATALLGGESLEGDELRLRYLYPEGDELHFRLMDGRMQRLELLEAGHVVQRVSLELETESRFPRHATYRNLAAFRELRLTRESVEPVESYPPDIWHVTR